MAYDTEKKAALAAEMLLHLGRLTHGGFVRGDGLSYSLTSAQWTALGYFARANIISRTLSAFAKFHATTRGTASQTIKSLTNKGYLKRTRSRLDARSYNIELTAKGKKLIKKDPFEDLVEVIAELPEQQQAMMAKMLDHMLGRITDDRNREQFGTCSTCRFLKESFYPKTSKIIYKCSQSDIALNQSQFGKLCVSYKTNGR